MSSMAAVRGRSSDLPGFIDNRFANLRTAATHTRLATGKGGQNLIYEALSMDQYKPLQTNPTSVPVLAFNTFAPSHLLHETARSRVRIGTELLETLSAKTDSQNLHHLVTAALVSLRDGLDMMGEIQRRLDAQAEQPV